MKPVVLLIKEVFMSKNVIITTDSVCDMPADLLERIAGYLRLRSSVGAAPLIQSGLCLAGSFVVGEIALPHSPPLGVVWDFDRPWAAAAPRELDNAPGSIGAFH